MTRAPGASCLALLACLAPLAFAAAPEIEITRADGSRIALERDAATSLLTRPLFETRDRLNASHGRELVFLYKMRVASGTPVVGRHKLERGPLRLTVYEITKPEGAGRLLRVAGSRFHRAGETAEFRTVVQKHDECLFLITAEAVTSEEQLNPHLRYMNTRDNEIVLKGMSTNWKFSALRFGLLEHAGTAKEAAFSKDADLLVSQLIAPRWVVAIRLEFPLLVGRQR